MGRPKLNKAEHIRRLTVKGLKAKDIADKIGTSLSYVYVVQSNWRAEITAAVVSNQNTGIKQRIDTGEQFNNAVPIKPLTWTQRIIANLRNVFL
jgi:transposase